MKRTERPRLFHSRMTAKTFSARSDGSAAVISSSISSSGSRASARARSSMRSVGSGRSSVISVRSTVSSMRSSHSRVAAMSVRVRTRFCATVRSGSIAGSWKTGAKPTLRAPSGDAMRTGSPLTAIVPLSWRMTPVRIFTSVLLPAPLAPSSAWISPGSTTSSADLSATTGP